jgi:hypothetical protein
MRELEMRKRVARFLRAHPGGTLLVALGVGGSVGAYEMLRAPPGGTPVYSAPITREYICQRWLSEGDYRDPYHRKMCGLAPIDAGVSDEPDARGDGRRSEPHSSAHRHPKKRGGERRD